MKRWYGQPPVTKGAKAAGVTTLSFGVVFAVIATGGLALLFIIPLAWAHRWANKEDDNAQ